MDNISIIGAEFWKHLMQALLGREAVRRHLHRGGQDLQRTARVRLIAKWLSGGEHGCEYSKSATPLGAAGRKSLRL